MKHIVGSAILALGILLALDHGASADRMTFTSGHNGGNCNDCEFTVAEGTIDDSTVDDFRKTAGAGSVYLNSEGGSLLGALALGNEFRRLGVRTVVGRYRRDENGGNPSRGVCASACAYAFLGGVERAVPEDAKFGMHAFATEAAPGADNTYSAADITDAQVFTGVLLEYVQRMGADPIIVKLASDQPEGSMRFFTPEELRSFQVTWNPLLLDPLHLEPYGDGIVATSQLSDGSATVTFFCSAEQLNVMLSETSAGRGSTAGTDGSGGTVANAGELWFYDPGAGFETSEYKVRKGKSLEYRTAPVTDVLERFLTASTTFSVSYGEVRGEVEAARAIVPTEGMPVMFQLLKRNCI